MNGSSSDIIENLNLVTPDDPWLWVKVLVILAVLAALAGLVAWRLVRTGKLPFFQTPPIPPEKSALERLAALRHLIGENRFSEFVHQSSGVLREYIEARYALRAPRLSTEEFLYEAEQSPTLDAARRSRLSKFLFACDNVKFGLGSLDIAGMEALYHAAEGFIVETSAPDPAEGTPR